MRPRTLIASSAAVALVLAPAAAAHVTVNPNKVAADSFARFAIRVPNERPNADTTKVTVRLPQGLFFVSFQPKPGWKRTVTMENLDPPATVFGEKVTERVATVTWQGARIAPGEFDEFGMSAKVPNAPGRTLVFPALQTYSNGEVVRWIGAPDADEPASRVTLGPKEEEGAAAQATPQTASSSEESAGGDDSEGRANLALGFGIAGLVAGLAALGLTFVRRRG
jgi:periplasmic copper chaperone A